MLCKHCFQTLIRMGKKIYMKNYSINILKYASSFASLLVLYPFVLIINGLLGYDSTGALLKSILIIAIGYSGYILGLLAIKLNRNLFLKIICFITALILPISSVYYFMKNKIIEMIIFMLLAEIVSIIGLKLSNQNYSIILSNNRYFYISITYLISIFFLWIFKIPIPIINIIICYLFMTIVYGFAHNRANIEEMMTRRKYPLSFLPEKITSYNTRLLGIYFACILLGMSLIKPLVLVYKYIANAFKLFMIHIIEVWLSSIIKTPLDLKDYMGGGGGGDEPQPPPPPPKIPPLKPTTKEMIIICVISAILLTVFFLIFKDVILKLLFSRSEKKRKEKMEQTNDYTDIDELVEKPFKQKFIKDKNKIKQWKKDYQSYLHMIDGVDKFKFGFSLAVKGLDLKGIPIAESDTTIEILQKSKSVLKGEHYGDATYSYNDIKYGNNEFYQKDIENLNQSLIHISFE